MSCFKTSIRGAAAMGLSVALCLAVSPAAWADHHARTNQGSNPATAVHHHLRHDPYAGYQTSTTHHAGFYSSAARHRAFTWTQPHSGYYAQSQNASKLGSARSLAQSLAHRRDMTEPTYLSQRTVIVNRPTYVSPSGRHAYVIHNPRYTEPSANKNAPHRTDQMTQRLWNHADRNIHAPKTRANVPLPREYPSPTIHSSTTNLYARKLAQDLAQRRTTRSALDAYYRQYYRTDGSNAHVRLQFHSGWNTYDYPRYPYGYRHIHTYSYPFYDCAPNIFFHNPTFGSRYGFHHHRFQSRSFHHHWHSGWGGWGGWRGWGGFHHPFAPNCVRSGVTIWFNF